LAGWIFADAAARSLTATLAVTVQTVRAPRRWQPKVSRCSVLSFFHKARAFDDATKRNELMIIYIGSQ
jgi:hypothetical protein